MRYGVVTPVRDEVGNLSRLAESLDAQTAAPHRWVIADNGSGDGTLELARRLADEHAWVEVVETGTTGGMARGAAIVRAFHAGLKALGPEPDVVVKVDADVSFPPEYFERLLAAFAAEPRLGIASGSAHELGAGGWQQRHVTGTSVWGAARAYRRACLEQILPLDERMGWDSLDEFRANVRGWTSRTFTDLPFRHHRGEGERDGRRTAPWVARGRVAHHVGYRLPYLVLRALFHARREPAALAMISGYLHSAVRRDPRCDDAEVLAYLRAQQSLRRLPARAREALGR